MRRAVLWMIIAAHLAAACSHLPELHPETHEDPAAHRPEPLSACRAVFPPRPVQMVHSIDAKFPGGRQSGLVGVTVVFPAERRIHCVLMTVEGVVLFSARYDGTLSVEHAVSPFDRKGFGEGLMADLVLIFLAPGDPFELQGRYADGDWGCRYRARTGEVTDVRPGAGETWSIRRYTSTSRLSRSVDASGVPADASEGVSYAYPRQMMLTGSGPGGYVLSLTLIEAHPVERSPGAARSGSK
ncbi:MAG: hypothetical protein ACOWWM_07945 [Desulfobacterales bacterium]